MVKKKSKKKSPSRRRTATKPDLESTIIKTNQAAPQGLNPRLGSASSSVIRTQPKTYSPQYLDSNLNFPRDVRSQNAWNRNFFVTNPIVSSAIRLHAAYTTGKFKLVCKDRKIKEFFEDMLEKMNFQNTLLEIGLEYWKLGEVFPYAELDEEHGVWDYIIVHNPDFIHVPPPNPLQKDPIITLVPDESLKRLVTSTDPRDRALRNDIPPEVLLHIQKGEDIPLDNFNVSHLKMLSSPYDTRGTSLVTSCYRDLLLYDKIREAKIIQADNFINPLTLVKLGSENYKPTDDDIRQWQEQVLDSMGDQGYSIVTHALVEIQKISNSGQTLDMNPDLENAIKNIMVGLNVPQALFDQDYGSYASATVGLEVLKDRYRNLQIQLKKWIERKILEPIAKIQDFYATEGGEEKLIVPTVEFDKINLKETDSFIGAISGLIGDPATPGSGKISMHTFYELLDTDYEAERVNLKMEARDSIVLMKEIAGMQKMDLAQLKTLNENTPIQDPGEIDSLEKSLDIEDDAAGMSGGGGGGDMGMGGEEGDMGMGGMGGDMAGGDMAGDMGGGDMAGGDMGGGEAAGGEPPA